MAPASIAASAPVAPPAERAGLLALYRQMARVRRLNDEAIALQRQGVLPAFAPCTGQEAAQVGSALALDPAVDFMFPTYREFGAMLAFGVTPRALLAHHRGYADGGLFDATEAHVAPLYASVGATALHAVGWAMGAALQRDPACAIAYFGDGASSQGDVHEAMNFAAVFRTPVVFFCQNNQWAISVPSCRQVGGGSVAARAAGYGLPGVRIDGNDVEAVLDAAAEAVARARAGEGATVIEAMTYRLGPHATSDDPRRYRSADDEAGWVARDPLTRARARLLDSGGADEATLDEIDRELEAEVAAVLEQLRELDPFTLGEQRAWAYRPRQERQRALPAVVRAPAPTIRAARQASTDWSMQQALREALRVRLEEDERTLIFGEDVGRLGGVFRVTDGLQARFGAERVFDTPLAEAGIVGTAAGLCMRGYRPIVEIQFDGFAALAFDQIVNQVARLHGRSRGALAMPMVIRVPSYGGIKAPEHHSESIEAHYANVAGLRIVSPSAPGDAHHLLLEAARDPNPVLFLEPKSRYWTLEPTALAGESASLPAHASRVVRRGGDVTLIAWGPCVSLCLEVADFAAEDGVEVEVLDLRWLKPLDVRGLVTSVSRTRRAVVVHEAPVTGGLGAEIATTVTERCFAELRAPVERVGAPDMPYPSAALEDDFLPKVDDVLLAVQRTLGA
jgi:2-oxoisovalerate dehydrogenase E1 component beta subunit